MKTKKKAGTTIQIKDNTWKTLNSYKETGEDFDSVLQRIIKMIRHYKLKHELESIEEETKK